MDKNKVIQNAQKYVQKGNLDKAIKEYAKVIAADPKDVRTRLKIGDLHAKKGDTKAAAETYLQVAEAYGQQGFFLKAVAVYKQILKLNPDLVEVNLKLAELYHQLGLMSDAMAQYQSVANHFERAGNARASFDTLRKMLDLDPDNVASRIKLAEMYSKEGMTAEAVQEFRNAASYLKERNRIDDYIKVVERLIFHEPGDIELTREVANIYLAKGDTKRALAKLQICFKANPRDAETLELLARAFRDLGQVNKTVSVYRELAKIYGDEGDVDRQRDTWKKVLEHAPDDAEAMQALGMESQAAAPSAGAAPAEGAAPASGRPPGAGASVEGGAEQVAKLLTETEVYVKYGLHDKAVEHLKKVFALDPDNLDGHEKAKNLFIEAGNNEAAGHELVALINLEIDGNPDKAKEYLNELYQYAPRMPEVQNFIAVLGQPEIETVSLLDSPADMPDDMLIADDEGSDLLVADGDGDFDDDDDDDDAFALDDEDEFPVVDDDLDVDLTLDEDEDELEVEAGPGEDEGVATQMMGLEAVPELLDARSAYDDEVGSVDLDEDDGEATNTFTSSVDDAPSLDPVIEPSSTEVISKKIKETVAAANEDDFADEVEEAEFFIQQGLPDEAREVLNAVLSAVPDHAEAQNLLGQLDADPDDDSDDDDEMGTDGGFEDFDLAGELADELATLEDGDASSPLEDFQVDAGDVFAEFKKGIAATVSKDDADTHYDLGIAYREMGLVDDAIGSFELAAEGIGKRVDALTMIGVCRGGQGDWDAAIVAFKDGLATKNISSDAVKALYYEVGNAYEEKGEVIEAIAAFERVVEIDPKFRDVTARLAALKAGGTDPSPNGSGGASKRPDKVGYV